MSILISEKYLELNKQLHKANKGYGGGFKWAGFIKEFAEGTVLDYGCGKGQLSVLLPELNIVEYDPAIEGKDTPPNSADTVICIDVIEHVEPEYLDNVLAHLVYLTKKKLLLVIACRPGNKYLPDGRLAHLIVKDEQWWVEKLSEYGNFNKVSPKSKRELATILVKE